MISLTVYLKQYYTTHCIITYDVKILIYENIDKNGDNEDDNQRLT